MWAFIFPGQGSQSVGMAKFLFENFHSSKLAFEEASDHLKQNFKKLLFEGSESELQLTENTQPALVLASECYHRAFKETCNLKVTAMAGHSLGEYSALVATKSLTFQDALFLVKNRGQFMQSAVPVGKGGMLAVIGLEDSQVEAICKWTEEKSGFKPLCAANYNAPSQVVISGDKRACDFLIENYDPQHFSHSGRVRFIPLNVSAPFHSSLMMPAEKQMKELLNKTKILEAQVPVVQNIDAKPHQKSEEIRENLIKQISGSVCWSQSVNYMKNMGIKNMIEMGPGKVLSGLVKKIDSVANGAENLKTFNIANIEDLKILEKVMEAESALKG